MNEDEYLKRLIKNFSTENEWSDTEEKESMEIIMALINLDPEELTQEKVLGVIRTSEND